MRNQSDRLILAQAARIRAEERKEAKAARPVSVKARLRDIDFLHWLHEGIPCIACMIEGTAWQYISPAHVRAYPIEAAHQKHTAGKGGMLGKRPDDGGHTCPLCAWHHRLAPNACDPAQRKFWDRLDVSVADYCGALFAAFLAGGSGRDVAKQFADGRGYQEGGKG